MSVHAGIIPSRGRKPSIPLRRAWREGKRIRKEKPASLTGTPPFIAGGIRAMLKGGAAVNDIGQVGEVIKVLDNSGGACFR